MLTIFVHFILFKLCRCLEITLRLPTLTWTEPTLKPNKTEPTKTLEQISQIAKMENWRRKCAHYMELTFAISLRDWHYLFFLLLKVHFSHKK